MLWMPLRLCSIPTTVSVHCEFETHATRMRKVSEKRNVNAMACPWPGWNKTGTDIEYGKVLGQIASRVRTQKA